MAQQLTLPPLVQGKWLPMTSEEFDAWAPDDLKAEWVNGKGIIYVTNSEPYVMMCLLFKRLLATFLEYSTWGRSTMPHSRCVFSTECHAGNRICSLSCTAGAT